PNRVEPPTAAPITRTWSARETGRDTAFLPFPLEPADSIRTSSNIAVSPRPKKTPLLAGRFRRGRRRHGFLSQFQCLLHVPLRRIRVLLLFRRIRVDLRFLSAQE